jgi:hypothetical protein
MDKPRSDAKLLNLPPEAQDRIYTWLTEGVGEKCDKGYKAVVRQIWLDLNIRTSEAALSTFWRKVVSPRLLRRSAEWAQDLNHAAEGLGLKFEGAALAACQQQAFELMATPGTNPKTVISFFKALLSAQKLSLQRESLAFERDKFKTAIATKIDLGLAELFEEIKSNPEALELFERMKACVRKGVEAA